MLKGQEDLGYEYPPIDTRLAIHDENNTMGNSCHTCSKNSHEEATLHDMIPALVENQPEKEANEKNLSPVRWKQKALVDKQQNKSLENGKTLDEHKIEFVETGIVSQARSDQILLEKSNHSSERKKIISVNKRVTIHYRGQHGKLIILPDSLEELLKIAGKHQLKNKKNN